MSRTVSMQFGKPGGTSGGGGSGGGGNQYTLLWENPNPDSSFAAQDIAGIDLSPYDMVGVKIRFSQENPYQMTLQTFFWDDTDTEMRLQFANSNNRGGSRSMTYNNETKVLHFGGAAYNSTNTNSYVVPQKIYGISTRGVIGRTGATGASGVSIESVTKESGTGEPGTDDTYEVNLDNGEVGGTFTVHNGADGEDGVGVSSVTKASGTGAPGTNDTYNVNLTDGTVGGTFSVHNGSDGQGSPGSQLPLPDGTAATGTATAYSREDHVHPKETTQTLTPTVTKTSGNSSIQASQAVKCGNIVQFELELRPTGTTNAGSNIFVGTLSDIPLPAIPSNGSGYMGSSAFIGSLDPDGLITIRVLAANRASATTNFMVRWTYICS